MADLSTLVIEYLAQKLVSTTGVNAMLDARRKTDKHTPQDIRLVSTQNIAVELMERSNQASYPGLIVYCEKLSNTLLEKFRVFSGTAKLTVEVRNSSDRLELMASTLVYTDIVCGLLDTLRGEWMTGIFYGGGYEVNYSPIKAGGKHFVQAVKVSLEIVVSN